jgi:hypothetical protein
VGPDFFFFTEADAGASSLQENRSGVEVSVESKPNAQQLGTTQYFRTTSHFDRNHTVELAVVKRKCAQPDTCALGLYLQAIAKRPPEPKQEGAKGGCRNSPVTANFGLVVS